MGFVDLKNKNNFDFYALEGVIEKAQAQFVKKWGNQEDGNLTEQRLNLFSFVDIFDLLILFR